jgi:hypothetical protein
MSGDAIAAGGCVRIADYIRRLPERRSLHSRPMAESQQQAVTLGLQSLAGSDVNEIIRSPLRGVRLSAGSRLR